jgi:hypothetical protein
MSEPLSPAVCDGALDLWLNHRLRVRNPHPQITMSEPLSRAALRQPRLSPDEFFRQQMKAAVRDVLAWHPKIATHASVSGVHPETGTVWTAYRRRKGRAALKVWLEEGAVKGSPLLSESERG